MKLRLPDRTLSLDRTRIMGILNATPDSFYDGGAYPTPEARLGRARKMVADGVDIIDIGGEKAGPGDEVSIDEEIERVVPLVEAIKAESDVALSVDTRRPEVARVALASGADMVNSITGFTDPRLRREARDAGAAIVIMHIQGQPRVANPEPVYQDVAAEVSAFLRRQVAACLADGIAPDRIVIDPGPGFGKTANQDLKLLGRIDRLIALPYPVLLAASRKKFIGEVLGSPPGDRLAGSLAAVAWGVMHGVRIVRVHDVEATRRVCRMLEAVLDPEWEPVA